MIGDEKKCFIVDALLENCINLATNNKKDIPHNKNITLSFSWSPVIPGSMQQ